MHTIPPTSFRNLIFVAVLESYYPSINVLYLLFLGHLSQLSPHEPTIHCRFF